MIQLQLFETYFTFISKEGTMLHLLHCPGMSEINIGVTMKF